MIEARPAAATPLACTLDPDRWFDRANRTTALEGCLRCPARRGCAREALRANASWGMWAGIWIDGRAKPAARYLAAIAADWPPRPRRIRHEAPPTPTPRDPIALPQRPAIVRRSTAAVVTARSSGHCEVMTSGCRLTADRQLSRVVDIDGRPEPTASELFCACGPCAQWVSAATESARAMGYLVASPAAAGHTPFRWRAARWVLLGSRGDLAEVRARVIRSA